MTEEEKTKLKWSYLLEKLRFGIQVIRTELSDLIYFLLRSKLVQTMRNQSFE